MAMERSHTAEARPKEICWIDSQINSLKEVPLHVELVSLNLHCNNIHRIENLTSLRNLRHLDLSSNHIKKIDGLQGLLSLRTLNLSCNQLTVVENLGTLRCLVKLDLSYNLINNLSGFSDLHGNGFSISHVYLHGNQTSSIEHVINCLGGCTKLQYLTLQLHGEDNPVCRLPGYRDSVLTAMRGLQALDGWDRCGKAANDDDSIQDIPGLEYYMEFLMSSTSSELSREQVVNRHEVVTPRIDEALNRFHQRPPLSSDTDSVQQSTTRHEQPQEAKAQPSRIALSADHEVRLEILENQLAGLLYNPNKTQDQGKLRGRAPNCAESSNSDDSDSGHKRPQSKPSRVRVQRPTKTQQAQKKAKAVSAKKVQGILKPVANGSSSSTSPPTVEKGVASRGMGVDGRSVKARRVTDPEDDATFLSLIQELDAERERRWKAEQAARKLVDHIKNVQLKAQEDKKLQEAALAASARLKQALVKERDAKNSLQQTATNLQSENESLTDELNRYKETAEEQRTALRNMEEAAMKLETERIQQRAQETAQLHENQMRVAAMTREVELLKHSNKQIKGQVHQLQELLASREQEHKNEMQGMVKRDSPDMRELIDRELAKQEARQEQLVQQYQERLDKKTREYAALEDEFRMALQIEANRFRELQEAFEQVSQEGAQSKQVLQTATQKESKATSMVNELTAMVKEQRGRITELSRGRQEMIAEYKERLQMQEKQLSEARKQLVRLDTLEQDKSKLTAHIRAQESVLDGLRKERKLWSEELAQQGASLAQDRGRLEAKIEARSAEVSELKKQSQSDNETIRIKAKVIEDLTDTVRKLKQTIADRDRDLRQVREENAKRVTEAEQHAAMEADRNQELQERVDTLVERKETLKAQLNDCNDELEKTKESHRSLKAKWQERSELISQMEKQVVQMRDGFKDKENKLVEERDKAVSAGNTAIERLRSCDDAFRQQLESQQQGHVTELKNLRQQKDRELEQAHSRVLEVEDEMRQLLQENALTKKTMEMRIKKLTSAFNEIQEDLAS